MDEIQCLYRGSLHLDLENAHTVARNTWRLDVVVDGGR